MGWTVPIAPVAYTPQIATDTTARTVNTTSFTQVSGDFSIAANDPDAGSVYIITCWGTVTWTTTGGIPEWQPVIFGTNLPTIKLVTTGAGNFVADFILTVILIVTTAGASGSLQGVEYLNGVVTPGTAPISGFTLIGATSVNTTAASVFGIQGAFTSLTGTPSPTMTVDNTIYERDGPGAVAQ